MIEARWAEALTDAETAELRELVTEAAAYDAEAGFSRIDPDDVGGGAGPADRVGHLVVRAPRDDEARDAGPMTTAAYGRIVVTEDRDAVLQLVVRPAFRSRGVATMLLEQAGARIGADGWGPLRARHVRWTAYGDHPAAERLALRFGLDELDRTWKMLRHLSGPFAADLPPLGLAVGEVLLGVVDPVAERAVLEDLVVAAGASRSGLERLLREGSMRVVAARDAAGRILAFAAADAEVRDTRRHPVAAMEPPVVLPGVDRPGLRRALLADGLQYLKGTGAAIAEMHIDPADAALVAACRVLGYEQDQSDVVYGLPLDGR